MEERNYYEVLGVKRRATPAAIKKAHRQLALALHPDMNPDDDASKAAFMLVQEAYEVLSDPEKRAAYDEKLDEQEACEPPRRRRRPARSPRTPIELDEWVDVAEAVTGLLDAIGRLARKR